MRRFGHAYVPMDETLTRCAIDLSNRPYLIWKVEFTSPKIGDFDTELCEVFFEGFARGAGCNLHMHLTSGTVLHHIIEICFKAFARALRQALELDPRSTSVPSTKGTLA